MEVSKQTLTATAQLFICELMLQGVCDQLQKTKHYKFKGKMHINELQKLVSEDLTKHYLKLNEDSEQGLHEVWDNYEKLCDLILNLKVGQFPKLTILLPYLLDVPDSDFMKLIAILESFKAGEIFEAKTTELLNGFIKQGRVIPVNREAYY